ncbi:response regulator [Sphingomonas qilianensis]|uniref:Response regulator n=1 Tax=Sphingomonas qilianensis TaxID=1736690 RepID=A0ABU9XP81_9SPHN
MQLGISEVFPVYVVDDDPVVRESIDFLLSTVDIACRKFDGGVPFLAELPALADGCLLLDLVMPQANGLDVMRALSAAGRTMPITLMTAAANAPAMRVAAEICPFVLMEKPFDEERLFDALEIGFQTLASGVPDLAAARARDAIATLSADQLVVLQGSIAGMASSALALLLGISEMQVRRIRVALEQQIGARDVYHSAEIGKLAGLQPLRP